MHQIVDFSRENTVSCFLVRIWYTAPMQQPQTKSIFENLVKDHPEGFIEVTSILEGLVVGDISYSQAYKDVEEVLFAAWSKVFDKGYYEGLEAAKDER